MTLRLLVQLKWRFIGGKNCNKTRDFTGFHCSRERNEKSSAEIVMMVKVSDAMRLYRAVRTARGDAYAQVSEAGQSEQCVQMKR